MCSTRGRRRRRRIESSTGKEPRDHGWRYLGMMAPSHLEEVLWWRDRTTRKELKERKLRRARQNEDLGEGKPGREQSGLAYTS